jgi:hypothetical protein
MKRVGGKRERKQQEELWYWKCQKEEVMKFIKDNSLRQKRRNP